jgi:endonuclease/exonuclease/phosphatase family metal-dependent hydrolase
VQILNCHLSIWPFERLAQARALAGHEWLRHPDCQGPIILCGDLNTNPGSPSYRALCAHLRDAQHSVAGHRPLKTWSGKYPLTRLDHVLVTPGLDVVAVRVPRTHWDQLASDHLPLVVDIRVPDRS